MRVDKSLFIPPAKIIAGGIFICIYNNCILRPGMVYLSCYFDIEKREISWLRFR